MDSNLGIKQITQQDERHLAITWTDTKNSVYDVVYLRKCCPCAVCVDELSGKRKLKDEDIADTVRPLEIHSVGRYALSISFDDGHRTGIYSYQLLRQLDPNLRDLAQH